MIGSYSGPVVADGFSGYKSEFNQLKHINLAFCWAHARCKFTDIEKNYPKEVDEILTLVEELFHIERIAKKFDDLASKRKDESKKIVDKIKAWLLENKMKARRESEFIKAINYSINHWERTTNAERARPKYQEIQDRLGIWVTVKSHRGHPF